ncbi:MAG TPA: carboxypeptidase-like regulatory domain-containing protein, partial [Acidobacteriaceae bacterium]|nr:carboxypeptidase-like regulatory domain-containing protein [Acidobacteriaceae bacterium]
AVMRAQVVGATLAGRVQDRMGASLPGASVTVRNDETGAQRALTSDADGRFSAPSLPVGAYSVTVAHSGFATQEQHGIALVVGQTRDLTVTLDLGTIQQQVVVSTQGPVINTSTQETSGLVDERQVKQLPLNGRSFDGLLTLNPATVNYTAERSGSVGTSNSSVGNMFGVSGRRPQDNLFLLNGVEYTGASLINVTPGGTSGQLLGVDAVREFNVVTDTYGASYGKRDGAQVSIVTMSGTNAVHGAGFEFLRNSALDARNYFDRGTIPEFQRNQFGGSLGGPLRRDKLFLFGNYEGFRQNWGLSAVTLVPDARARQGYLPDSSGAEQYVGVNAAVAPLLALWPAANGPELGRGIAEAFSHPEQHIWEDFGTSRFDANLTSRDLLFAVYTVDDSAAKTPTQNPLSLIDESLREQVASVQEQHTFTARLLNTARFGYSRASYIFNGYSPVAVPGWVAGKPVGAIVISGSTASNGASQVTLAGTNVGSNNVTARNLFTADDHIYYSHGNHQLEAGGWVQRIQSNDLLAQYQNGQASFSTLQSFLQGTVATFTVVPAPTKLGWRSLEGAAFVEDTWKVRPRFELRAGFRSESTDGWNEAQGRASNYAIVGGVLQTDPVVGNAALTKNRAKFLLNPRVGFAWDVRGNGKTAVRGGFGIYHGLLDTLDYRLDQTAPFNTAESIKNIAVADLHITPGTPPPAGALVSPSNVQPDIATPAVLTWSLRVEQQVAPQTSLTAGYVGSHSYHQILSEDMNEPVPVFLADGSAFYPAGSKNANPQLANTTSWVSQGVGLYNALQVDVRHDLAHGFQVRGDYTWSKNLDDGSAWNTSVSGNTPAFVEFPLRPKLDWGPGATDVRHVVSINGSWELPFGHGRAWFANVRGPARVATEGWSVSSIVTLQSGFPFSPQLGYNPTGNGDTRNPVRPNWNSAFHGRLYPGTASQFFNPNAFLPPATGTYGNVRRDSLVGPGVEEIDFSATKNTALSERVHLQFRAEFFNLLNHTNLLTPNEVVYTSATSGISPTAGVVTATSTTSRQIQFGAKVVF